MTPFLPRCVILLGFSNYTSVDSVVLSLRPYFSAPFLQELFAFRLNTCNDQAPVRKIVAKSVSVWSLKQRFSCAIVFVDLIFCRLFLHIDYINVCFRLTPHIISFAIIVQLSASSTSDNIFDSFCLWFLSNRFFLLKLSISYKCSAERNLGSRYSDITYRM